MLLLTGAALWAAPPAFTYSRGSRCCLPGTMEWESEATPGMMAEEGPAMAEEPVMAEEEEPAPLESPRSSPRNVCEIQNYQNCNAFFC